MPQPNRMIEAIMGPHRGKRLQMPEDEAQAAINAHWAADPFGGRYTHEPLTDEERRRAMQSAIAWADAQVRGAGNSPAPAGQKDMKPEAVKGGYLTRQVAPEEPPRKPKR